MDLRRLFFLPAALFAVWAFVAAICMVGELQRRGVRINWWWIRLYLPKYIHQYRQITRTESGQSGPLWRHFIIPVNLAWILVVLGLLAHGG